MKCVTPEISWHNRDPVLSIDIQNGSYKNREGQIFWRVASGGADYHVLIWHMTITEYSGVTMNCMADLERHQKAVNVVRFSPSKKILASGDDESVIILWKLKEGCDSSSDTENNEQWASWKVLKGHLEDIYDISWAPNSNFLISGSVDNTAILWDVKKGRNIAILSDHKGFVQGVSWDPCNQYVCTISTDRQCRLIDIAKKKVVQRVHKSKIPTPPGHPLEGKVVRLFYDDTFKSFFRRLTFTIDGSLIIVPSGIIEPQETTGNISNATIIFSRHNIKEPIMILPTQNEITIAVRCCPVYFELRKDGPDPTIMLPYRMVFAVATQNSVLFYDTQQIWPIGMVSNIHYGRLNDISWSSDGRILIVSSSDGYCSIIHFDENELGQIYTAKEPINLPKEILKSSGKKSSNVAVKDSVSKNKVTTIDVDESAVDIDIVKYNIVAKTKVYPEKSSEKASDKIVQNQTKTTRTSNDPQQGSKLNEEIAGEETEDIKLVYHEDSTSDAAKTKEKAASKKTNVAPIKCNKAPRRVQLITLSSPREPALKKQ
ncbi:chromatin assembly factor 1 subunit B [Harpegnathos saltator]|uniref:Chromatin assembly factor 1 subunit B n=1 Tax=Harpegnathos saltator TaxID=610380 RepID=E2C1W7_HARSA|nr:chromatin assembly factor 1 subunit B [Harpegnathos saltator]EFN78079.1 Chromatin assembly factor 1 subunit B [Harpegnathos saltator]